MKDIVSCMCCMTFRTMTEGKKMLLLIFLVCYCSLVSSEKKLKMSSEENDYIEEPKTMDIFKPSHEWQIVKKGQAIPRGLHIRVNLETGETEAKLLSDSNNERTDVLSVHDETNTGAGDGTEHDEHAKSVRESLVKLESQEKDVPNDLADEVRKKFRSYKEIKDTFQTLHMSVKTELEIVHELVFKYKSLQKNRAKTSEDELLLILTDLEYLVHQFDNALEFVKLEGVSDIVLPLLNGTHSMLRAEAAHLLGSAAQSHVKVQIVALESGVIAFLLKAVSLDSDPVVKMRSLYALSCLIRNFPAAQAKFVKEGGLSVLAELFEKEQTNHPLQIKVITLLHDLLLERQYTVKLLSESLNKDELEMKINQYKAVGLEKTLLDHGWCSRIPQVLLSQDQNWSRTKRRDDLTSAVTDLPVRPEHDFVEKLADALLALVNICHQEFNTNTDLKRMIGGLRQWYVDLASKEDLNKQFKHIAVSSEDDDNDEGYLYYSGIANTLESLTVELDKYRFEDEL